MSQSAKISYYRDGILVQEMWVQGGIRHREDGPQFIYYLETGEIDSRGWVQNGEWHRTDGPAYQTFHRFEDRTLRLRIEKWLQHGKHRRDDGGPCEIIYFRSRDKGEGGFSDIMCCFWYNEQGSQFKVSYNIGTGRIRNLEYRVAGGFHRPDGGPTIIYFNQDGHVCDEMWATGWNRLGILLHREDGPASIEYEELP